MTAVIRPVCIKYTDLCHSRIAVLIFYKIILNVLEILECHSQIQGFI